VAREKWDAVEEELDYRVIGAATADSGPSDDRFRLAPARPHQLDGLLFYLRLPPRLRRQILSFRPQAIFASDPFLGAAALAGRALRRWRVPVIVEIHGDWRTPSRLCGSPARRLISPLADPLSLPKRSGGPMRRGRCRALRPASSRRRAGCRRARSSRRSATSAFSERDTVPLPERPTVAFVGALEAYKNVEGLAAAWRVVADRLPDAALVIVGSGSQQAVVDRLAADFPGRVEHYEWLEPEAVSAQLDAATVLVLPSWPEGLGRVIIESFAPGRAVVRRTGGIPIW
jgi:glycosyltransferase involved in cell wall biosynthesis